jgi:uncharacterized membrane protein HdeD (DUF308 family)
MLHVPPTLRQEFRHLRASWWWLLLLGILLSVCGTAAIVFPAVTAFTSFVAVAIVGVMLMISGIAIIVTAFWAGRWSGLLVQLLIGILYLVAGLTMTDAPADSAVFLTLFIATLFIVAGAFRAAAALVVRFPHWGWTLLNGVVTLMCGVIIYRHMPGAALWVIGMLVGIDLLFQGWTWIMLALAVRSIPEEITESRSV